MSLRLSAVLWVVLCPLLVGACGSGGSEDSPAPMLPPATPVPALAGTWCGPAQDGTGALGSVCITFDAEGGIERISLDNQSNGSVGTIQATSEDDVYTFQMSDNTRGWVALSASGEHLFYLDNFRTLGALDKTSPGLPPSYLLSDLDDDWIGRSLYLDAAAMLIGSDVSGMSVGIGNFFTGQDGPTPFANQGGVSLVVNNAQFGRYRGRYQLPDGTRGDLELMMAADKAFVVGTLCVDGGTFAQDCSLVFWERAP